jgi:hypothetical protein
MKRKLLLLTLLGLAFGLLAAGSAVASNTPTFTSNDHATFVVGYAGTFTVTTTGDPVPTITETGALPAGVTFTDNGDGTATFAGTPPDGTAGTYSLTITATNSGGHSDQAFVLEVANPRPPEITSGPATTFTVGVEGTFTVTTSSVLPQVTVGESGALPSGVTFTDNGDGTATLAGTPAAHTGGDYSITIRASNGVEPDAEEPFVLQVNQPPVIDSADHVTFEEGRDNSFDILVFRGNPTATTISRTGPLPVGVDFQDNHDGTATLSGNPALGEGGTWSFTITASNGVQPDSVQLFTLTVTEPPSFNSADHTTFNVGSAGNFTVTTHFAFPTTTTLTETGSLPSGVTFTDNGDGTASLEGTPATGSGGTYSLTFTASNGIQPDATQAFTLVVIEDDDLALSDIPTDVTVNATSPHGAVITYTAPTVIDEDSPRPSDSCSPASGSTFAIGMTTVTCTATDADDSNSPVTASFHVTVVGAGGQLQALLNFVSTFPPGTSLPSKVQNAINYFNANDIPDTCKALTAVINQAKAVSGKKINKTQANAVIAMAKQIQAVLGC